MREHRWRAAAAVAGALSLIAGVVTVTTSASADTTFTFGSGFAQASLLTPALNAGELSVPIIMGEAAAGFQDETGRATSTTFAIPLLGATGGGGIQCGVKSDGTAVPLPDPLYADTSATQNKKPVDKQQNAQGLGVMVQEAHAKPNASGASRTQFTDVSLPGVVTIGGAFANAETTADPAKLTRKAHAITRVADVTVFGGLIRLTGLKWELTQERNGADSRMRQASESHAFTFDGITIDPGAAAGLPTLLGALVPKTNIPIATPDGAAAAVKTANAVLEPLGLTIELPKFEDNGQGRLLMTPLKLKLGGPNWVLTPILGGVISREEVVNLQGDLFELLFDPKDCDQLFGLFKALPPLNAEYNTVGEVAPLLVAAAMGVVSGGSATVSIGGVATALDDTYFPAPEFGGPSLVGSSGTPAVPGLPGALPSTPQLRPVLGTSTVASSSGKCHTSSPAGAPRCWNGLAPLAAAVAGVVALGSLAIDEISTRRRVARLARNEIA